MKTVDIFFLDFFLSRTTVTPDITFNDKCKKGDDGKPQKLQKSKTAFSVWQKNIEVSVEVHFLLLKSDQISQSLSLFLIDPTSIPMHCPIHFGFT